MRDVMTEEKGLVHTVGKFSPPSDARFAVVAARFNSFVVDRLLGGAIEALGEHGVDQDRLSIVRVPGAWEVPLACQQLCASGRFEAVVALAAVIRGGTPHFDYVAGECARGCSDVMLRTGVPVLFGVLTTDTVDQAIERAGQKADNKGWDAAMSALEMAALGRTLSELEG